MDEGIPLGKVVGFPLSIDWSVLVIMWLFTWSLAATLPDTAPGHSSSAYWLAGACGAAVLLASLLAQELTHAIVARHRGVEVLGVKLWLFGGIARLGGEAKTPGTEFRIAVSGPAMSLTLAADHINRHGRAVEKRCGGGEVVRRSAQPGAVSRDDGPNDWRLGHSAVYGDTELPCCYHLNASVVESRREGTTITEHWACATNAQSCGPTIGWT